LEDIVMFDQLIARWWIVAIRGVAAVVFGVAALAAPDTARAVLVSLFGFFAFADGIFTMGAGLSLNWLTLFLEGVIGIVVGMITAFLPALTGVWFGELIATWAFVTGTLALIGAFNLRRTAGRRFIGSEWLLALSGDFSVAFGALVVILTSASPAFMPIVAGYALCSGILLVALSLTVRTWPGFSS